MLQERKKDVNDMNLSTSKSSLYNLLTNSPNCLAVTIANFSIYMHLLWHVAYKSVADIKKYATTPVHNIAGKVYMV